MVQGRSGTSFPSKASDSLVVSGKLFGEKFQRHQTTQAGVFGFVDDTHSSAAQLLKNSKVRNGLSDHNGRRSLLLAGPVRPRPVASQSQTDLRPWILGAYLQARWQPNFLPVRLVLGARWSGLVYVVPA